MQTQTWCAVVGAAHADGLLTRAARDVLFKLARLRSRYRVLWPSHAWLAAQARCCRKTVVRALAQARELGLISWGVQRWLNARGWRRGTNVYRLQVPPVRPSSPKGQIFAQRKQSQEEEEAQGEVMLAIVTADRHRPAPSSPRKVVQGVLESGIGDRTAAIRALEAVREARARALGLR